MNTIMINVINWLVTSGWLASFLVFLWKLVKPLLEEKRKQAKTVQQKEAISLMEQLCQQAVDSQVSVENVTGHDKFKRATQIVNSHLADKGISMPQETVEAGVQSAYENSDLTPTINPSDKPQTGVVSND